MSAFKIFLEKQKNALPRLPVPHLQETIQLYLKSVQPFLTEEELKVTEELAREFAKNGGVGETLQKLLEDKAAKTDNWLSDWWLNAAYLDIRQPLPVYCNTSLVFPQQKFSNVRDQLAHAAAVIAGALDFKETLLLNKITPEKMGSFELDMSQFLKLYSVCRIPGEKRDSVQCADVSSLPQHITVLHNNHFFAVPVYDEDGKLLNQKQITSQLEKVIAQSSRPSLHPIGILTTENRTEWSKARDILIKDGMNRQSLDMIERGNFVVCLDGPASDKEKKASDQLNATAIKMMHGGGIHGYSANRWFDHVSQFIVGLNGEVGLSYEHSPGDSHPIITDHMENYWLTKKGAADPVPPAGKFLLPEMLKFNVDSNAQQFIMNATKNIKKLADEIDINCFIFSGYGKEFIKLVQLGSPDTFIQMAIQLAYFRIHKEAGAQYESAMTRKFLYGRTETIRACSLESVNFARIMMDPSCKDGEKVAALRSAMNAHRDYVIKAVSGKGVDRHLLGLRLIATDNGIELPPLFQDTGFIKSSHMKISTSQVPAISNSCGFFGPLVHDGYSCCYNPRANEIVFGTTAFTSCLETNVTRFGEALKFSLCEMREVLERTLLHDKL